MSNRISSDDDIIDSRDVIKRIDELEGDHDSLVEDVDTAREAYEASADSAWATFVAFKAAEVALYGWENSPEDEELSALKLLALEADCAPDWIYGAQLINYDYFEEYIKGLINDCYGTPREVESGEWPWRHMVMDWSAAAEEAKRDYMTVEFNGTDFYIQA